MYEELHELLYYCTQIFHETIDVSCVHCWPLLLKLIAVIKGSDSRYVLDAFSSDRPAMGVQRKHPPFIFCRMAFCKNMVGVRFYLTLFTQSYDKVLSNSLRATFADEESL